jgi:multidrug efflux pump subunit AcrA (membrane-fusion protein)
MMKRVLGLLVLSAVIVGGGLAVSRGVRHVIEATSAADETTVPHTSVRRGTVVINAVARGEIQGKGAETLVTPMTGAAELPIIEMRRPGELVHPGDVVVAFDTTQQEYEIREAEANLQEAEQQVIQAEAQSRAALEEARYQAFSTEIEMKMAEQEIRKNVVLAAVRQRENEIALDRARNRHVQARQDLENRQASSNATIQLRRAAVKEAARRADAARRAMESMTLRARTEGYVHLLENRNATNILFTGMSLPPFQIGDAARPGQPVAQIPNMSQWEVSAQISETDRGYIQVGQKVHVIPAAVPGRELQGHITLLGAAGGNAWNRTFNIRIALDESDPGLRPGMSANVRVTAESLDDVLWIPSQALFENDGRAFVYVRNPEGYVTHDVTLVRRSESQAVITGINEGSVVALARPGQQSRRGGSGRSGVLGALPK